VRGASAPGVGGAGPPLLRKPFGPEVLLQRVHEVLAG
jgi:hypothetical protein